MSNATVAAPENDEAIRRETIYGNEPCFVCYISMVDKVKTDVFYWILVMPPAWQFAGLAKLGPSWRNCQAVSALILCDHNFGEISSSSLKHLKMTTSCLALALHSIYLHMNLIS